MSETDDSTPPPTSVDAVLARLTLEEKASLVLGSDFWHTAGVERLGVPAVRVADGPHGLRVQPEDAEQAEIGGSLPATCFPTASALASSWDPVLLADVGHALAHEARAQGVSVLLGPGINIKRSPLCGRNFEYLSEDPHLAGELAHALVDAVQSHGVGTSLKHFAANNQEDDRLRVSAEVDERTLREIYLPAFERVVTGAQPWTVMCAYNKVNGTYASEHHWLLTRVLREEWGFTGLVVSDWGAVHDRVAALAAGLDLEMPPALGRSDAAVSAAVREGRLPETVLDAAVRRVLELEERSRPALLQAPEGFPASTHHALARRAAAESAVLLKNDGGLLPLAPDAGSRVAVVGAFAQDPRFQGAGSSEVNPTQVDSPLEQLRAALPDVEVTYAPGFDLASDRLDERLLADAQDAAAQADVVVAFLGLPGFAESEGFDRTHLDLPGNQVDVLTAVRRACERVVVVLANGSVVRLSTWEHLATALLETHLGGQAVGGAVADLLTGALTPSGKLAETVPLRLEDTPSYLAFPGDSQVVRYGEGLFVGYRGFDAVDREVSHPFGFGLSYTTFALEGPAVEVHGSVAGGDLEVSVTVRVRNTGARPGAEVVQVYVADPQASVTRPLRELRGFAKVFLAPGESREVTIRLGERAFAYWSVLHRRWVVEAGEFVLHVGTSSRDFPHAHAVRLEAPSVALPLTRGSTLREWLDDDAGREALTGALADAGGDLGVLAPARTTMTGPMPVASVATFGVGGLTHAVLDEAVGRLAPPDGPAPARPTGHEPPA